MRGEFDTNRGGGGGGGASVMPLIPRAEVARGAVVCLHCRKKLVDDIQGSDYRLQFKCPRCHKITILEASQVNNSRESSSNTRVACMVQG